jgi:hypothetical protein
MISSRAGLVGAVLEERGFRLEFIGLCAWQHDRFRGASLTRHLPQLGGACAEKCAW